MTARVALARKMIEAADTIAEVNGIYSFDPEWGVWNPTSLRKEALIVASDEQLDVRP